MRLPPRLFRAHTTEHQVPRGLLRGAVGRRPHRPPAPAPAPGIAAAASRVPPPAPDRDTSTSACADLPPPSLLWVFPASPAFFLFPFSFFFFPLIFCSSVPSRSPSSSPRTLPLPHGGSRTRSPQTHAGTPPPISSTAPQLLLPPRLAPGRLQPCLPVQTGGPVPKTVGVLSPKHTPGPNPGHPHCACPTKSP